MRALIQRVSRASVSVGPECLGEIEAGLLILVCAMRGDDGSNADRLAAKIARLRIFPDDQGRMNRSIVDVGGAALVVSQFTLAADTSRGNRPGFTQAAAPQEGERLYENFASLIAQQGIPLATGRFGADMAVELVNDGPVTLMLEV